MSGNKNEIAYYPEICLKMEKHLKDIFGTDYGIAYSINKSLSEMVNEIYSILGVARGQTYYPSLKTDVVFGIKLPSGDVSLILFEIKRGKTLGLMNFSQLVGYLQVAKHIKVGVLLLVNEGTVSASPLSSDFSSIIDVGQLPTDWQVWILQTGESLKFRAGICMYTPSGSVDWMDSSGCNGISSWESLKESILS
jgi:hypothetical protein